MGRALRRVDSSASEWPGPAAAALPTAAGSEMLEGFSEPCPQRCFWVGADGLTSWLGTSDKPDH